MYSNIIGKSVVNAFSSGVALIQRNSSDPRIRTLFGGIGCMCSGVSLIYLTLRGRQDGANHTFARKAVRLATATVGVAVLSYGVYQVATGAWGLMNPPTSPRFLAHLGAELTDSKEEKLIRRCNENLGLAKVMLSECPDAKRLFEEVEKDGPMQIGCTPEKYAPSGALANTLRRQILISVNQLHVENRSQTGTSINSATSGLLFELNNMKQAQKFNKLQEEMCSIDPGLFTRKMEAIEYITTKNVYQISKKCVDQGFWPKNYIFYENHFNGKHGDYDSKTFEGHLKFQEKTGHMDVIEMQWYKICNKAGLAKWYESYLAKMKEKNDL